MYTRPCPLQRRPNRFDGLTRTPITHCYNSDPRPVTSADLSHELLDTTVHDLPCDTWHHAKLTRIGVHILQAIHREINPAAPTARITAIPHKEVAAIGSEHLLAVLEDVDLLAAVPSTVTAQETGIDGDDVVAVDLSQSLLVMARSEAGTRRVAVQLRVAIGLTGAHLVCGVVVCATLRPRARVQHSARCGCRCRSRCRCRTARRACGK